MTTDVSPWENLIHELRVVREPRVAYGRRRRFSSSRDVFDAFRRYFEGASREEFLVVPLDCRHAAVGFSLVAVGSLTAAIVHPREVLKLCVLANAAAFFCLHNHPSGDPEPSPEDVALTRRLCQAGELIGIRLLDHLVFGDDAYASFADRGMI